MKIVVSIRLRVDFTNLMSMLGYENNMVYLIDLVITSVLYSLDLLWRSGNFRLTNCSLPYNYVSFFPYICLSIWNRNDIFCDDVKFVFFITEFIAIYDLTESRPHKPIFICGILLDNTKILKLSKKMVGGFLLFWEIVLRYIFKNNVGDFIVGNDIFWRKSFLWIKKDEVIYWWA